MSPIPTQRASRLDVYVAAVSFHAKAEALAARYRRADARDQLLRAALSIVLNIAEGSGRVTAGEKAHFYAIARGSARECSALLDVMGADRQSSALLVRIVQMLTRLIATTQARR